MSEIREVRILTRNFVDSYSTITTTHGGTTSNLFDRDKNSKYRTSGAKRDTITAEIEIIFKVGNTETEMTFNNFIMLNTNVKEFTVQKYVSGAYIDLLNVTIPNGQTYSSYAFDHTTSSRVKILLKSTKERYNQEKEIGELIIARLRYVMASNPVTYNITHREKKQIIELANGDKHIAYTRFSTNRISKYGASVAFSLVPQDDFDFLESLKNEAAPFIIWPEHDVRPQEIYYVNWINPFVANYTSTYKGAGYDIKMELEEV